MRELKDEYVSTEHLLLALAGHHVPGGRRAARRRRHEGRPAEGDRRGPRPAPRHRPGRPRTSTSALERFGRDLTEEAERGQARPGHRPRRRDPPRHPGPQPPHEEQPRPDRRARRRQDRDRRGPRPAHRLRRRPRVAARPPRHRARHRRAARRLEVPRRVRGAPQGGPQRDQGGAAAPVILFLDELHTIVGAGAAEGAVDAANLLKPMLARGELRAVGATTLDEYRKHIEKDAALERRFQPVLVGEPSRRGRDRDPARPQGALRGPPRRPHPGHRADRRRDAERTATSPTASCPTRRST